MDKSNTGISRNTATSWASHTQESTSEKRTPWVDSGSSPVTSKQPIPSTSLAQDRYDTEASASFQKSGNLVSLEKGSSVYGQTSRPQTSSQVWQRMEQLLQQIRQIQQNHPIPGHGSALGNMGSASVQQVQQAGHTMLQTLRELLQTLSSTHPTLSTDLASWANALATQTSKSGSASTTDSMKDTPQATASQTATSAEPTKQQADSPTYVEKTEGTETKEKSIWEKIGDFFKQAFSWLLKIFELLSPLLNLIPGMGPALFAAYQGIKLLVNLIKQDVQGIIGSMASVANGIAGAIGGVASSILQVVSKATQAGQSLAQAVDKKQPLGVLGALGGFFGNLGGLGKSLEQAGGAAGEIGQGISKATALAQQGLQTATSGATVVQAVSQGNMTQSLQGLMQIAQQWQLLPVR